MKRENKIKDLVFEINFYENILKERPDFTEALIALADAYTKNRQYQEGLKIDQRLSQLKSDDPFVFYNLACSYSLVEEIDAAFEALKNAINLGYNDFSYVDKDPDLENLKKDRRYQDFLVSISVRKKRN